MIEFSGFVEKHRYRSEGAPVAACHSERVDTEEALAGHDVDLPFVFIDAEMHRRACRCADTCHTAAGPVSVTRTLFRARHSE